MFILEEPCLFILVKTLSAQLFSHHNLPDPFPCFRELLPPTLPRSLLAASLLCDSRPRWCFVVLVEWGAEGMFLASREDTFPLNHPLRINSCVWSTGSIRSWSHALASSTLQLLLPQKQVAGATLDIFCTHLYADIRVNLSRVRPIYHVSCAVLCCAVISRAVTIKLEAHHLLHP